MPILETSGLVWSFHPFTGLALLVLLLLYARGWRRMRLLVPGPGNTRRLLAFVLGWLLAAGVFFSPLFALHDDLLLARTLQQILLGLVAAPLLWLGAPFHTVRLGLPARLGRAVTRRLRRGSRTGQALRAATQPATIWLVTVASFLVWTDPAFVQWSTADELRYVASLWGFGGVYLLFWMHVTRNGPRLHPRLHPGVAFLYVLLGGEVPNMATGVTLAFREYVTYPVYAAGANPFGLSPLLDQTLSGCLIWVLGTFIYVSICLGILGRVFRNEDAPRPMPIDWQATHRTIAPGLEHRVP